MQRADDTIVDAAGEGTALIKIDNPRSTIVLQYVLHVPVCGNNQLISITQLTRKGAEVYLDFKGAIIRKGGTLVAKALLRPVGTRYGRIFNQGQVAKWLGYCSGCKKSH